jgi:hypothetical protein
MKFSNSFLLIFFSVTLFSASAQNNDSVVLAKTFNELTSLCKNVDFGDPKSFELGYFYKAAPYIVYRGEDVKRKWKAAADYSKAEDKKGVDYVCERINQTANQDKDYKIVQYFTEKESEGTWYILMVTYLRKGIEKKSAFAFLKIDGKFLLGDID